MTIKITRLRRNDNVANVIHWDLAGKCGFADRTNVKIKVLQVCGDVQERKGDFIGYTRGDAMQIL